MPDTDLLRADLSDIDLYEADFTAWCDRQAALAQAGRTEGLDLANIAKELESLGRSQRHQIRNRLRVLLIHLLKWTHQPEARSRGWLGTIDEQRERIALVLEDSPSLAGYPAEVLDRAYAGARRRAAIETGLPVESFPADCPVPLDQALDPDWLPPP